MAESSIRRKKILTFWNWFGDNGSKLRVVDVASQKELLGEMLKLLHNYNEALTFEISDDDPDDMTELTITALGNREAFSAVELLVREAPKMEGWKIGAFRPPKGFDIEITHEGLKLSPKDMWFIPLSNPRKEDNLGLRVAIPKLPQGKIQDATDGTWILVDAALGEKISGDEIQHIEVVQTPEDPQKEGFIALPDLEQFIEWRQKHNCQGPTQKPPVPLRRG